MGRRLSTAVADNAKLQRASLDHLGMAHAARQLERDALGAAQGQPRQYKLLVAQRVLEIEKLNGKRVWIVWPPRQRASPAAAASVATAAGAKAPSGDNDSPLNDGTGVAGASASDGARESANGTASTEAGNAPKAEGSSSANNVVGSVPDATST